MSNLYLEKLTLNDEISFTNYLSEQILLSGAIKGVRYEDGLSYKDFLNKLNEYENISFVDYNQSNYPSFQYVLRDEFNNLVGCVLIRPYLTKELNENFEGNIGYSISPKYRGKGYANVALKLAVNKFKELNLTADKVVLCCYKENIPSKKVIIKNGGELVEELKGVITPQKYYIKL